MTMAQLLALGAPKLRVGSFYRVTSDVDGFVYVEIRENAHPSWRTLWRHSSRICRVIAPRTDDPEDDVRRGCEKAVEAIANWVKRADYWDGIKALEGDHR